MTWAMLEPFSGISGDMTLGALLDLGLAPAWLEALPAALKLDGVSVTIRDVMRSGIACKKVDFAIPPQPHGRHLRHIRAIVEASEAPQLVKDKAIAAFTLITQEEARIHAKGIEQVHLHEVGSVDAILDIVGSIWGLSELGVDRVFCGPISLGDGFVEAAHGRLPVPAPATMRLLEGLSVRPGPPNSGELVTPTGAALVRVLSEGPLPAEFTPVRSGYGAGTKEFADRANALRITLAQPGDSPGVLERLTVLATDIDDMTAEHLAATTEHLLQAGALDVVQISTHMKKGRLGTRIEVLVRPGDVERVEGLLFMHTSTLGVRRAGVERRSLARSTRRVMVDGHAVRSKDATLPNGGVRSKPEFEDVRDAALALGQAPADVARQALAASEQA